MRRTIKYFLTVFISLYIVLMLVSLYKMITGPKQDYSDIELFR